MFTIEDAKETIPANPPPSYELSQSYSIEIFDTELAGDSRSQRHHTMSGNHSSPLPASDTPDEPEITRRIPFFQSMQNVVRNVGPTIVPHGICLLLAIYNVFSAYWNCAPNLAKHYNLLLGVIAGNFCNILPTILGLRHYFENSIVAQWVLDGIGFWLPIAMSWWMVITWEPAHCRTQDIA